MMPERPTTPGDDALAGALAYIDAGYYVGPVTITLRPDGKKDARFHTDWVKDPRGITDDPDQARAWAARHPDCSWHAPCGPNEIVVVEGDVKGDESGVWNWRKAGGPSSPMKVTTRSGGEHWYFRAPGIDDPDGPIRNSAGRVPGIHAVDVRGDGGTVFIAGSVVLGGGGSYHADAILGRDRLPQLTAHWARRLREAGARERAPELDDSTPQVHDRSWLETKTEQWFTDIASGEQGGFRERLFAAAFFGFHAVEAGILERDEVLTRCYQAIRATWDHEPDDDDREWLRDAWRKAQANPWTITEGAPPAVELSPAVDNVVDATLAAEAVKPRIDDEPSDEVRELTPEELAEREAAREERAIDAELQTLRRREKAKQRLQAEDAPKFRALSFGEFKLGPEPEPIVPGLLYRDSLSRIFGAPGCGKSFLALDLAFSVALGKDWGGEPVQQASVAYVMAEGQRVNKLRAEAWQGRHGVTDDNLEDRFYAVPDALALTEAAIGPFVAWVKATGVGLVVLDTKNAMQVGEENSATDAAVMRRALDAIRKATDACVVLIDHTGKHDGEEARGSSAVKAAMDTEIKVENDHGSPALVTVTVSRDKAAEAGKQWEFLLRMAARAAVLVAKGDDVHLPDARPLPGEVERKWQDAELYIPEDVLDFQGLGKAAVPDLAKFMAHDAGVADPDGIGVTQAEAKAALSVKVLGSTGGHSGAAVRRAWSALRGMGYLVPADGKDGSDGRAVNTVGKHVWTGRR